MNQEKVVSNKHLEASLKKTKEYTDLKFSSSVRFSVETPSSIEVPQGLKSLKDLNQKYDSTIKFSVETPSGIEVPDGLKTLEEINLLLNKISIQDCIVNVPIIPANECISFDIDIIGIKPTYGVIVSPKYGKYGDSNYLINSFCDTDKITVFIRSFKTTDTESLEAEFKVVIFK